MKNLGAVLIVIGVFWAVTAFNFDTSVTTESRDIRGVDLGEGLSAPSIYIPSVKVNNIGKMDERRNHLMLSALLIVVGVIFFVAGSFEERKSLTKVLSQSHSSKEKSQSNSFEGEFEERWENLVKYDERIQLAITQLQPYGDAAIDELKQAFHAINDFTQLPRISTQICQEKHAQTMVIEAKRLVAEQIAKLVSDQVAAEKNSLQSKLKEESISEAVEEGGKPGNNQTLGTKSDLKKNLYYILGVQQNSSQEAINEAYVGLLNKFEAIGHDDTSVELFSIRNAHDVLSDPKKKAAYDEKLEIKFEEKLVAELKTISLPDLQIGGLTVHQGDYGGYDFFEILGVSEEASTSEEVEAAYKTQIEKYKNPLLAGHEGSANIIKIIDTTYAVLSDSACKSVYKKMFQDDRNQPTLSKKLEQSELKRFLDRS